VRLFVKPFAMECAAAGDGDSDQHGPSAGDRHADLEQNIRIRQEQGAD
jgi:hypothetical protein